MKFPYIEFLGVAEERIFRPIIPVTFKVGKESFKSYSLIDSGSDYTILPIEVAGNLKIKLSKEQSYRVCGAGGETFTIYKSPSEVEYIIQKSGFRTLKWESHIYFAESGSTFLLGQSGFLNYLKVTLDGKKKEVEIKK